MTVKDTASESVFTRGFIIGTAVNFLLYVNYYVLMVVTASYCMNTYDTNLSVSGLAASIFILGALIARFLGGAFIDRVGRKRSLVISALCETALSACYLLGGGIIGLFAIRILHGFFYGIAQTTVTAIVTELVPESRKGEGIGYYMLSSTIGSAIGPFLGMALMQWAGFNLLFVVCAAVAAASFLCAMVIRQPKKIDERAATSDRAKRPHLSLSSFVEPTALPISTVMGIAYLAYGAVITYLSAFASSAGLMTAASFFFVVYSLAMMVCRPFTGRYFDRHGDLLVMLGGLAAFMIGMALLSQSYSGAVMLLAACFIGFGIGAIQPSGLTLAVQKAPDEHLTVVNSTYFMFLDIAIGLCPVLLGWTVDVIGYRGLFLALVAVVGFSLVLYLVFRKRRMV